VAVLGECGRKWPKSELASQMPCNPITLYRNLRIKIVSRPKNGNLDLLDALVRRFAGKRGEIASRLDLGR
jgi:hypothetical protein